VEKINGKRKSHPLPALGEMEVLIPKEGARRISLEKGGPLTRER